MPIDLKNGGTLHCPTCKQEIRVAWLIQDGQKTAEACFCSCPGRGFLQKPYSEDEILEMIRAAEVP